MDFDRLTEDWIFPLILLGIIIGSVLAVSGVIKF